MNRIRERSPLNPEVARENANPTNKDLRVLMAMEDGKNQFASRIQEHADRLFGYRLDHNRPEPKIDDRLNRFVSLGLAEYVGRSEYRINPHGKHILSEIKRNPGIYSSVISELAKNNFH